MLVVLLPNLTRIILLTRLLVFILFIRLRLKLLYGVLSLERWLVFLLLLLPLLLILLFIDIHLFRHRRNTFSLVIDVRLHVVSELVNEVRLQLGFLDPLLIVLSEVEIFA